MMTNSGTPRTNPIDEAHEERLRICAELGQFVPINKPKTGEHYEQPCAQQLANTPK